MVARAVGQFGQRLRAAAGDAWVVTLGLTAHYLLTALSLIVVARKVGPDDYGQFVAGMALATFLVVLPNYGLDTWMLAQGAARPAELIGRWRTALALRLAWLALWLIGMALLAVWLPAATYPRPLLAGIVAGVALESIAALCLGAQRSLQEHRRVALVQSTWAAAVLALALVLPLGVGQVARFTTARAGLAAVVALLLVAAMARRPAVTPPGFGLGTLARTGRPFFFSEIAALVYMKADLVLVGLLLGAAGASVYGPALNLLNVALIVPTSLFYVMVPILSHAFVHEGPGFGVQVRRQTALQFGVGILLSLALWLAAPAVVWIYGPAYAGAVDVLRLLAPLPVLRALNFALAAVLIGGDCQQARTWVQWVAAGFNVAANLLVIRWWGVAGVAAVFVLTEALLTAGYALVVYRRLGWRLAL